MASPTALRNTLIAATMCASSTALLVSQLFSVNGTDQHVTTVQMGLDGLSGATAHPTRFAVYGLLVVIGFAGLTSVFAAIASLARDRGAGLATWAAGLGMWACFSAAVINVVGLLNVYSASRANASPDAMAQFIVASEHNNPALKIFALSYFFGLPIAAILISVALYRSRTVARWVPPLFVIGLLVGIDGGSGAVGALLLVPFVASIFLIARTVAFPSTARVPRALDPVNA